MATTLSDMEARVIGVLLEKSVTTPEQYPLSLNALTNGCNQKSNRFPITQFTEDEVIALLDGLKSKRIVQASSGYGSRVDKYSHRFCNTEFGDIKLSDHQQAIITELLLRGAQTPGELRGRCQRLAQFADISDVEATISSLLAYQPDPLIYALPREAGKREIRYNHTFCDFDGKQEEHNSEPQKTDTVEALRTSLQEVKSAVAVLETRINKLENGD
ncbi:YceH family protein [Alteromonas sp. 1_MG-2023]|uniref:YceH family protein n=1 Tax=Alteromonas sp. 1_MG-2023 TaxID=3062669 RepID=UPI0026E25B78|nr:YceH family protein [Alteromonas sp. 1_MG-2023]MDO6567680.1 YceH family protein [Alteromonas sp. 1_MG-2023]